MISGLRALRIGGLAAGIALTVSLAGAASADPTPGSGDSPPLSQALRADEDALLADLAKESDVLAQLATATESLQATVDALKSSGVEPSAADISQLQAQMDRVRELSEMNTSLVSEDNSVIQEMTCGKGTGACPHPRP